MHKPLTIAILYPYLSHRPWELRQAPILLELADTLHGVWNAQEISYAGTLDLAEETCKYAGGPGMENVIRQA